MKLSRFATSGIYFMAHAGKRPSLDQFIASASASFLITASIQDRNQAPGAFRDVVSLNAFAISRPNSCV